MGSNSRLSALAAAIATALTATSSLASTFTVDTEADGIDPIDCTLRAAILAANTGVSVGGCPAGGMYNSIQFSPNVDTIALTEGELTINSNVLIGTGTQHVTVDAQGLSRVFSVAGNAIADMHNITVTGGYADRGAGILLADNFSVLELLDVTVTGNVATGTGGGIDQAGGSVELYESLVTGNTSERGGGIHQSGGWLAVVESEVSGNVAVSDGGGAAIHWDSAHSPGARPEVLFSQSIISDNQAHTGGGLSLGIDDAYSFTYLNFDSTALIDNYAQGAGGGIAITAGRVELQECQLEGNSAGSGGGVAALGGPFRLENCVVTGNTAEFGGGVYVALEDHHYSSMRDVQVQDNNAAYGGGIALVSGLADLLDTSVNSNQAVYYGGGIAVLSGFVNIVESSISDNSAFQGGGIALNWQEGISPGFHPEAWFQQATISNNQAQYGGGLALAIDRGYLFTTLSLKSATLSDNHAAGAGGGVAITAGRVELHECQLEGNSAGSGGGVAALGGPFRLENCVVTGNTAESGGGVYVALESFYYGRMRNLQIQDNSANYGGGLALVSGTIDLFESTVSGNQAVYYGGGIAAISGMVDIFQSSISNNAAYQGGGIALNWQEGSSPGSYPEAFFWQTSISNNEAQYGGALALAIDRGQQFTPFHMNWVTLNGNHAGGAGGGVAITAGRMALHDCDLQENSASRGGGIAALGGAFELHSCMITGNTAERGGGIYAKLDIHDHGMLQNLDVHLNYADYGGGISFVGGWMDLLDSLITGNQAAYYGGGLSLSADGLNVQDSDLIDNHAGIGGGGVRVYSATAQSGAHSLYFDTYDVEIADNSAEFGGGVMLDTNVGPNVSWLGYDTMLTNNSAAVYGGAVSAGNADVTLHWCEIGLNSVTTTDGGSPAGSGGGIHMEGGDLHLEGCMLFDNLALSGGALYLAESLSAQRRIKNSGLFHNQARHGGAIAASGTLLNIEDASISNNQAVLVGRGSTAPPSGSAIWADDAALFTDQVNFDSNIAPLNGGTIFFHDGYLVLKNVNVMQNTGGGLVASLSDVFVEGSRLQDNHGADGGALTCSPCLAASIVDSTLKDNHGTLAGGVVFDSNYSIPLRVLNSTISSNHGPHAGGIVADWLEMDHSTVAFNSRAASRNDLLDVHGGGVVVLEHARLTNNLIASNEGNGSPDDLTMVLGQGNGGDVDMNYTLVRDPSGFVAQGMGNLLGLDAALGPLQHNGGPTATHALLPQSPAINSGDPDFQPPPEFDQRGNGYFRLQGGRLDIGAYESAWSPSIALSDDMLDFGTVGVDITSQPMTVTIENNGDGALVVGPLVLDSGAFAITADGCSESVVPPSGTCMVNIVFTPSAAQVYQTEIEIISNADAGTLQVNLSGEGVDIIPVIFQDRFEP